MSTDIAMLRANAAAARTTSWPIGAEMRRLREAAGMTQTAVARRMFMTPHAVRTWEAGRRHPGVELLDAYLKIVGGSITLGVQS